MAVYRFQFNGISADGGLAITGLHYKTDPPPLGDEPNPADVLTAIDTHIRTAFLLCVDTDYVLQTESLREEVTPGSGDVPALAELAVNQHGTLVGGSGNMPTPTCAVIALKTTAAIRSARGYMALPSPGRNMLANPDAWSSGYLTTLNAFGDLLNDHFDIGTLTTTRVTPVVYSRVRRAEGKNPYTFDITAATAHAKPKFRRSRLSIP